MIIWLPLLFVLIGGLTYLLATPGPNAPKVAELGRIIFAMAFLACMLPLANRFVTLVK